MYALILYFFIAGELHSSVVDTYASMEECQYTRMDNPDLPLSCKPLKKVM